MALISWAFGDVHVIWSAI